ncbi:MAG: hypothetical protein HRT83_04515 [Hyphomicrobiaceae bacterium]|nr:hypothetical protein [Hyphomicrobiaceae bacterium]
MKFFTRCALCFLIFTSWSAAALRYVVDSDLIKNLLLVFLNQFRVNLVITILTHVTQELSDSDGYDNFMLLA